jgi:hypothetical protein
MLHNTVIKYVVIFYILLFCGRNGLYAATMTNYGHISIQEIPMVSTTTSLTSGHGYVEYRFRITNKDTKAHTVGLEIPKTSSVRGQTVLSRSANSITVPPQSTAILRLLQPPFPLIGIDEAQVIIDGRYQRDATPFRKSVNHGTFYHNHEVANILTGNEVPGDLRFLFQNGIPPEETKTPENETEKSENETETTENKTVPAPATPIPAGTSSATIPPELSPFHSHVPVEEWSDYWLAYTRFDAVIVTASEWNKIQEQHAGIFDALKKYTEAGGILGIVGTNGKIPKEWLPDQDFAQDSAQKYQAVLGLVYVFDKNTDTIKPAIEPFRKTVLEQTKLWCESGHYRLSRVFSDGTVLLSSLPVVADYGINIKLIMVLIILFAVLIGPINIYVLSVMKRKIWLIWTVPLTSLVTSILVLGVNFFQEGFLRQSSSATYTILDQRHEEAITFGFVGFYSTLTPRGIVFSPETEVTACIERGYQNVKSLEIYLTAGGNQFLTRGWMSARIPSYFALRKVQSQRKERITFDWTTDSPTATNGLGVDIKELSVCSPTGELLLAHNIKAGEKVPLIVPDSKEIVPVATNSKANMFKDLRQAYSEIIPNGPGQPFASHFLPAGSYRVETDVWNPFVEEGIDQTTPYQNKTIIFGIFE